MLNHVKYYVSLQHLESYMKGKRKPFYERIVSVHDTLDDAIENFLNHVIEFDPEIKYERDDIREEAHDEKRYFEEGNGYRITFKEIKDPKKFYFGPGAYVITKEKLS